MNVLSLFDGMSCGRIALERCGYKIDRYFASEIDKYAIKVAAANYPDTIHLGDVRDVMWPETFEGEKIDLLLGGSPCQGFSFAGNQLNFDDPRSRLFWEFVRILKEAKPRYFLLENVRMKKQSQDVISDALGVQPIAINSNLVSAQNRYRLYWTNIPFLMMPADKGIKLKDILEDGFVDRDKSHFLDASYFKGGNLKSYFEKNRRQLVFSDDGLCHVGDADLKGHSYVRRVYHADGKAPSLCAASGGNLEPKVLCGAFRGRYNDDGTTSQRLELQHDGRTNSLTTVQKDNVAVDIDKLSWRSLTPVECERLQTVPDNYTNHVSKTQRYKMLGNGWTVDVICHILKHMEGI